MGIQERIKENLLEEIYTDIDRMYEFMEQNFYLYRERHDQVIKQCDRVKEQFSLIVSHSRLS
jgi:hypothetical protein